jgi:hypothetical protein
MISVQKYHQDKWELPLSSGHDIKHKDAMIHKEISLCYCAPNDRGHTYRNIIAVKKQEISVHEKKA